MPERSTPSRSSAVWNSEVMTTFVQPLRLEDQKHLGSPSPNAADDDRRVMICSSGSLLMRSSGCHRCARVYPTRIVSFETRCTALPAPDICSYVSALPQCRSESHLTGSRDRSR